METRIGEPEDIHRFKNCLNVTLSYCDLLLDELPQESPIRTDIEEMRNSIREAVRMLPDLLASTRQEAAMLPRRG